MIWQPEFTDKTLSRKIGAVHNVFIQDNPGMHFRRVIRNAEGQRR
ncbi:hypothetical protein EC3006_1165 [Escherichia coli 3006]|nr:hypothetical protein EC3006_1165 [Escherichia coli 3006]